MKKAPRKKREKLEVTAVCNTQEEYLLMMILIVYCQHFYRKFKHAKKSITIFDVVAAARNAYNQQQAKQPEGEKSEIVWG